MSKYIDADFGKAIDEIKTTTTGDYIKREDVYKLFHGNTEESITDYEALWDAVKGAPAADVEPVRPGKWIKHHDHRFGPLLNDMIECSECHVRFSENEMIRRSYCPNCGARMDGDKE